MHDALRAQLAEHLDAAAAMAPLLPAVASLGECLCAAFAAGARAFTFGNGGSAADAQHLAAELVGRYRRERRPLPAVSLTTDPSVSTCIANDYSFGDVFSRQVSALAMPGDVVIGFTTSGASANVVNGLAAGRTAGATTALFAAGTGGQAAKYADILLSVPSSATARIQEMHVLLLHLVSEWVDAWAAGEIDAAGKEPSAAAG